MAAKVTEKGAEITRFAISEKKIRSCPLFIKNHNPRQFVVALRRLYHPIVLYLNTTLNRRPINVHNLAYNHIFSRNDKVAKIKSNGHF